MLDDQIHKIGFSLAKGMQGDQAIEMLRRIGSPSNFFLLERSQLVSLSGIDSRIFDDNYRKGLLERARNEALFIESNHIDASFWGEGNYPRRLQDCPDAPILTYKIGSCNMNSPHVVGIVGTRNATIWGKEFTEKLVRDLAQMLPDVVIVSGLAYGIDIAAHRAAIDAGIATAAVMAHGLDTIYPAPHRSDAVRIIESGGALLTEYPTGTRQYNSLFLARNRIVAGCCDCLVVVESDYKGGSMSTARIAAQYNREVMAVPGRVEDTYSRGTNRLIYKNVAALVTCAKDLMELMNWQPQAEIQKEQPRIFKELTADQTRILDFIRSNPDATVNDMCVRLGISYSTLSTRLFELEEDEHIRLMPGGRYAARSR